MMPRVWALCADLWTSIGNFAAARARGCINRVRRARGLPPLP